MKVFAVFSSALLVLTLGIGMSAYAQEDAKPKADEDRPQAQEQEKPVKPDEARPENPKDEKAGKQEEKDETKDNDKSMKQDENRPAEHSRPVQPSQNDHMQPAEGHSGQGGRIPEDKFRAHFGREHTFHVGHPHVVNGHPQFAYGGYTFVMVDPWPSVWGYNDGVYVDYIDGVYYLIDPLHPGMQIVLNVIL